jgi:hypothetical protein
MTTIPAIAAVQPAGYGAGPGWGAARERDVARLWAKIKVLTGYLVLWTISTVLGGPVGEGRRRGRFGHLVERWAAGSKTRPLSPRAGSGTLRTAGATGDILIH